MISKLDKNSDGILSPEEIPDEARPYVQKMARKLDIPSDQPIPVERLKEAFANRSEKKQAKEEKSAKSSSDSSGGFSKQQQGIPASEFVTAEDDENSGDDLADYDSDVISYVDKLMSRHDKNEDKYLDETEWRVLRLRGDPRVSDTNGDQRLSRAELAARVSKRWGRKQGSATVAALAESTSSSSSSKSKSKSSTKKKEPNREKVAGYAKSLMRQYDKNKNGVLEKEEWRRMRGTPEKADRDGNGVITQDELTDRLVNYTKEKEETRSARSSTRRKRYVSNYGKKTSAGNGKSYRFTTNIERLPKGLPDWFSRNDRDSDGQIAMHEFSTSWSEIKVREFNELDRNGDGVLTPAEYLKSKD